jgi:hypothetical protein
VPGIDGLWRGDVNTSAESKRSSMSRPNIEKKGNQLAGLFRASLS